MDIRDPEPAPDVDPASPEDVARAVGQTMSRTNPVFAHWGIKLVHIAPGRAEMRMLVRPDMGNAHGFCHGGVLFTLADTCFGFACNSYNERAVAASNEIRYLAPVAIGETVECHAEEVWKRERSGVYDAKIIRNGEIVVLMRAYSRLIGGQLVITAAG